MARVYSDAVLSSRPLSPRADAPDAAGARWAAEAQYLHRALLGRAAQVALQQAYVEAHRRHGAHVEPSCLPRVMQRRLDVEAVELALRARHPALSHKIHWVLTLAELHTDLHEAPAMHPLRAAWALVGVAWMTAFKRLKGAWLVWRHGLLRGCAGV